jgi:hypothetical protein
MPDAAEPASLDWHRMKKWAEERSSRHDGTTGFDEVAEYYNLLSILTHIK